MAKKKSSKSTEERQDSKSSAAVKLSHSQLVKQIIYFCEKRYGCFLWSNNTGAFAVGKRFIRYGLPGSADIIGIGPNGRFVAIEVKRGKDSQSAKQKLFQAEIESRKGVYILTYDLESVVARLDDFYGVPTPGLAG